MTSPLETGKPVPFGEQQGSWVTSSFAPSTQHYMAPHGVPLLLEPAILVRWEMTP